MKKALALLLTLTLLLLSAATLAESPAETVMDAAETLFFQTENVTLDGEAEFTLDGAVFKSAKGKYIQDQERSFWQLNLHTPSRGLPDNDPEIDSGYTIIADNEMVSVQEVTNPNHPKWGTTFPRTTILRPSVQLDVMVKLARTLAQQADTLLGEGAITATANDRGETEIHIVLDENVPDLVNTALTMAFQAVANRYFQMNYDQLENRFMGSISAYYTVTRGILYTTEFVYVRQADITVTLDAANELQAVSGVLGTYLQTGGDGEHRMDITFRLNVSDRGASKVEPLGQSQYVEKEDRGH